MHSWRVAALRCKPVFVHRRTSIKKERVSPAIASGQRISLETKCRFCFSTFFGVRAAFSSVIKVKTHSAVRHKQSICAIPEERLEAHSQKSIWTRLQKCFGSLRSLSQLVVTLIQIVRNNNDAP
jgi:hypothetical protein